MSNEDLAARIHAALLDALNHQERAGFTITAPGVAGKDGEIRLSVERVARIAAVEARRTGPSSDTPR